MSTCNNVRPGLRNGSKTGLCAHIFRLLRGRRVPWVLLENVPGLLMWHMNDDPPQPPAVSYVVAELESLGYRWAQRVVGLTGFGLPQRRRRVFILASTHGDPRDALLAPQAVCLGQCIELFKRDASAAANQFGVSDRMCAECALAGAYDRDPPRPAEATAVDIERNQKRVGLASRKCSERALARCVCNHPPRECYDCFWTPPFVEPRRTLACADLAEKRHGPLLHELFTLTTANGKRMAVVEDLGGGKGSACMLHVEDADAQKLLVKLVTERCSSGLLQATADLRGSDQPAAATELGRVLKFAGLAPEVAEGGVALPSISAAEKQELFLLYQANSLTAGEADASKAESIALLKEVLGLQGDNTVE